MAHPKAMRETRPDIVAGPWSGNLGHSCKSVRDAIVEQLDELPFFNTFAGTTHPRAIELSAALVALMRPDGGAAVMFGNGGSDAVESALKISRQYHELRGGGCWRQVHHHGSQVHHHGSMDDPALLETYQRAVRS